MGVELGNGWFGFFKRGGRYIWFKQPGREVFLFTEWVARATEFETPAWVGTVISERGIAKAGFSVGRGSRASAMKWAEGHAEKILQGVA